MIPVDRAMAKLDAYLNQNDYASAEKLLDYWAAEAEKEYDLRALLSIRNEELGLFRKTNQREKAIECVEKCRKIITELKLDKTVSGATILLNCATVLTAFNETQNALSLFEKAKENYETLLPANDERLGGLYNNYATALKNAQEFEVALAYYDKALNIMKKAPFSEGEQAITYLNKANAVEDWRGIETGCEIIEEYVKLAEELLETPNLPHNGHYAFVCEKCAPVFDYYGCFVFAQELKERAEKIYEGT